MSMTRCLECDDIVDTDELSEICKGEAMRDAFEEAQNEIEREKKERDKSAPPYGDNYDAVCCDCIKDIPKWYIDDCLTGHGGKPERCYACDTMEARGVR